MFLWEEKNSCSRIDKNWLTIDYANLTSMIQKGFLTPGAAAAHPILLSFNSSPQWNFWWLLPPPPPLWLFRDQTPALLPSIIYCTIRHYNLPSIPPYTYAACVFVLFIDFSRTRKHLRHKFIRVCGARFEYSPEIPTKILQSVSARAIMWILNETASETRNVCCAS